MLDTLTKTAIDAVQSSKKIIVDTFVKHEGLNTTLHKFVDAQTEYTKKAYEVAVETGNNVYNTLNDSSFYTGIVKDAQEQIQTFFNRKKKGK